RFAKYEGGEESGPRGRDRGEHRARMPGRPSRGEARAGDQRRPSGARAGPPRREGQGRSDRPRREERRESDQPLPEISLNFAPKGTYTFVAQCSLSGAILGPPNYHDYQNKLRKLHAERFARMPFEMYKSKVKIVKDEAIVKKWIEEQSWKTEFTCLNVSETKRLGSREEVEQHFREVHFANIIKVIDAYTLNGAAAQQLPSPPLRQLLRRAWDEQQRFPLKVVTALSQQFAGHGLQFFKVNKSITHVAVARPHYLDLEATPVSEGVKRIVDYINAHSGCTRRQLIEALAPSAPRPAAPAAPRPAEGAVVSEPIAEPGAPLPVPSSAAAPPSGDLQEPTAEQTVVIADLHWLIHQGHVIEFANGR